MKTVDAEVVHDEDNLRALVKKFVKGCLVEDDNHFEVRGRGDIKPLG